MITANFCYKNFNLSGVCVKGHAEYDDAGSDIVCAAVTSALEMTANAITEIIKSDAEVTVLDNEIRLFLNDNNEKAILLLKSFKFHFELLLQDYSENLSIITDGEVL